MAEPHQNSLTVQVKDKVLWIGSDAYPVQNIARAQARQLIPDKRKSPIGPLLKSAAKWVGLAIVASIVASVAHLGSAVNTIIWLVALGFIALAVVRMIQNLNKKDRPYYSLVIETAGTPKTALISDNENVIDTIISQIMKAINGEPVNWTQTVNNFYGDYFNQYGGYNTGKIQT